ncbi:MAG: DMT family transporter [Chitinophagaceae bacterium]
MKREKVINWMIFITLCFIWGSAFILMKWSKQQLNGYQIGAIRIFSAGLVFLPFAIPHLAKIPCRKILYVILTGMLGNFFPAFLFAIAIENKIDSSLAGILNSLTPLFVIVLAIFFFKTKVQVKQVIGVMVGFFGLLLLSLSQGGISTANYTYALLILIATFMYGVNVNIVSYYLKEVDPIQLATVSLAFMSIPAGIILWQQDVIQFIKDVPASRLSIIAAALLGIIGSAFATALFYVLIKRAGGLFASLITYGIPVVAIIWGVWGGEDVTPMQIGCLGMILGGVYLANRA